MYEMDLNKIVTWHIAFMCIVDVCNLLNVHNFLLFLPTKCLRWCHFPIHFIIVQWPNTTCLESFLYVLWRQYVSKLLPPNTKGILSKHRHLCVSMSKSFYMHGKTASKLLKHETSRGCKTCDVSLESVIRSTSSQGVNVPPLLGHGGSKVVILQGATRSTKIMSHNHDLRSHINHIQHGIKLSHCPP